MPVTADVIAVTPGSGKNLDAVTVTVGGNSVDREVHVIADPITGSNYAAVENADPGSSDFGLVTRDVRGNASLPVRVDPTGTTTQPVSVASLPLPSGASTSTKQPALGTAGTASSDVITIQGITGMTAVKVDGSAVTQPVSGTITANAGTGTFTVSGTVTSNIGTTNGLALDATVSNVQVSSGGTTAPSKIGIIGGKTTDATPQYQPLPLTNAGAAVKVDGSATTQPVSGTVTANAGTGTFNIQSNASVNLNQIAGSAVATAATGIAKVGITDGSGNAINSTSNALNVSVQNSSIAVTESGTWNVGSSTATGSAVPANAFYGSGLAKTSLPSAASDGNLTGLMLDKFGRQVCLVGSIRDLTGSQTTTISNSTSETTIVTAAASTFNDLVALLISNTSASTSTRIDFRDTTGGSVIFSLESIGGAAPVGFVLPIPWPQTSVNTNWTAQCATATTDIRIAALFVKNK